MWHKNITNDPYERYRQAPNGCRNGLIFAAMVLALMFVAAMASSCCSQEPLIQVRDSVRVEHRLDSVYIYQHDSIFRDRWRNGDTIFVTLEKYKILYKDKLIQVHDTIATTEQEQIAVEYVPDYYKNTSAGFWVLFVILLALIAWRVYKFYIKIKTGGLIK